MEKAGAGGWIVVGIALIVLGWLLKSNLLEAVLDIVGVIIMIGGVIAIILGGFSLISGKKGRSGGF
ncbi:MAG: hypothetical protein IIC33_09245 [Chloroflexi bacterium]|nr:hypothetical protein [Chloroflexota bacterium]